MGVVTVTSVLLAGFRAPKFRDEVPLPKEHVLLDKTVAWTERELAPIAGEVHNTSKIML
jgi:hypothetical protein